MTSVPAKMHAVLFDDYGDLDVITEREIDVPKPEANQVLIKVEYAGVNFIDTYFRSGMYKVPKLPFTLGQEAAGTVAAVGASVKDVKVGDRVASFSSGAYAEYSAVNREKVVKVPDNISSQQAAAAVLQGLTAITMVRESYAVQKGDFILVHAAAGGVGQVLVQICKAIGARVIATASTAEKLELAKGLGAEFAINSNDTDLTDQILKITSDKGVAGIFDGVGKATFEDDFKVIARKGTIVVFGAASGQPDPFGVQKLAGKNVKITRPTLFNAIVTQEDMDTYGGELLGLVGSGKLKLQVHKEYPFSADGVRQSQADITSRKTTGKLLIKVAA